LRNPLPSDRLSVRIAKLFLEVNAIITPKRHLDVLSKSEIASLQQNSHSATHTLFRNCALAVLSTGADSDDGHALLAAHKDFNIEVVSAARGVKIKVENAPDNAFVEGEIIEGIRNHLFAVLRDIVYLQEQVDVWHKNEESLTDMVFKTLRHAKALRPRKRPNLIVCWGGHSISKVEYDYSKEVGYRLGLRGLDICTGCGIGAMKGPMKGAAIAHAKQRVSNARYIGITEPGIIASEAPNAVVNELIIMPDIEKRLEAFVRMGHGIVVFPGGAGTAEDILYILGLLLHPENQQIQVPLIFTGPESSKAYFEQLDAFIGTTLGSDAQALYKITGASKMTLFSLIGRSPSMNNFSTPLTLVMKIWPNSIYRVINRLKVWRPTCAVRFLASLRGMSNQMESNEFVNMAAINYVVIKTSCRL